MNYETTMSETRRACEEVRAIMRSTGARKVTRRDGKIYLDGSTTPWDGKTPVKKQKRKSKRRGEYDLYLF